MTARRVGRYGRGRPRRRLRYGPDRPGTARGSGRVRPGKVRRYGDRGQAVIEFTGTIPVILLTIGLLWQAALTGYTFSLAGNAADEAARAGAVGGGSACADAARRTLPGNWQGAEISCRADGELYRATVRLRVPAFFPGAADLPIPVSGDGAALDERSDR
ncbi:MULTISPECIES: TadE/TadG family type IV pilus assembly protein [Streptomyces]|uniref:TadE/TadG family type IV pilus assembly protein n=1 Tax=Streptomyces TaxID=1883 RepID=UPI00030F504D|nr:TadE/TadG family type IV pilus assembly protein [Streptomyces tsukubensis]